MHAEAYIWGPLVVEAKTMGSLSYIVYVLASLLNPVSFFLHGHRSQYSDNSNRSIEEHDDDRYKAPLFVFGDSLLRLATMDTFLMLP